jgi:pimeloyl-ACP methyl ester carboxylesterase
MPRCGPLLLAIRPDRDFFLIEMPETDHEASIVLSGSPQAEARRAKLRDALIEDRSGLARVAIDPGLLADEVALVDETVRDTVFVIHGIRDDGFWTHRIAERIRQAGPRAGALGEAAFRAWTPTYGYFPILPFLLPWVRRQKVEWFVDQYVSALAQYPNTEFHDVGHSNGTYLAARSLSEYPAPRFKNVLFAGSVVRSDFPWAPVLRPRARGMPAERRGRRRLGGGLVTQERRVDTRV